MNINIPNIDVLEKFDYYPGHQRIRCRKKDLSTYIKLALTYKLDGF